MSAETPQSAIQLVEETMERKSDPKALALQALENEVLQKHLEVFADAACFTEIDPEETEPPLEWQIELGYERAMRKFRAAKYALLPGKEAPIGMSMAKSVVTAAVKAHAERSTHVSQLNIGKVLIVGGNVNLYEEVAVDD